MALGKLGPPDEDAAIREVHDHWQAVMGKRGKLRPERKAKVGQRLREGFSVEQLKHAVDGCKASPFHRGENDKRTIYDDLMLICRNGSKVEMFLDLYRQHTSQPDEPGMKYGLPIAGSR